MTLRTISFLLLYFCIYNTNIAYSQDIKQNGIVFLIGDNDEKYSQYLNDYPVSLLTVSNDSMELAYLNWMYLLKDIEDFAKKADFDLNGIKIWLNVFWNKNGKIDFMSYYPKPNSRNMDLTNSLLFLKNFSHITIQD
ncbi:MAG: hypothetical protein R2771_01485 [Saprospiraceae bacterium]